MERITQLASIINLGGGVTLEAQEFTKQASYITMKLENRLRRSFFRFRETLEYTG